MRYGNFIGALVLALMVCGTSAVGADSKDHEIQFGACLDLANYLAEKTYSKRAEPEDEKKVPQWIALCNACCSSEKRDVCERVIERYMPNPPPQLTCGRSLRDRAAAEPEKKKSAKDIAAEACFQILDAFYPSGRELTAQQLKMLPGWVSLCNTSNSFTCKNTIRILQEGKDPVPTGLTCK
jgi:hypothetical protein